MASNWSTFASSDIVDMPSDDDQLEPVFSRHYSKLLKAALEDYPCFPRPKPSTNATTDDPFSEMDIEGILIPAQSFPIMSLPDEILQRILRMFLATGELRVDLRDRDVRDRYCLTWGIKGPPAPFNVNLLRLCKKFHRLGQPIFYGENVFNVPVGDQKISRLSGFFSQDILVLPKIGSYHPSRMRIRASIIRQIKFSDVMDRVYGYSSGRHGSRLLGPAPRAFHTKKLLRILQLFLMSYEAGKDEIQYEYAEWYGESLLGLPERHKKCSVELCLEGFDPEHFWCCPDVEKVYLHMTKQATDIIARSMQGFFAASTETCVQHLTVRHVPKGLPGWKLVKSFGDLATKADQCSFIDGRGNPLHEENSLMVPPASSFRFMDLAVELQTKILQHALDRRPNNSNRRPERLLTYEESLWSVGVSMRYCDSVCTGVRDILVSCRKVFHLSMTILFERFVFELPCPNWRSPVSDPMGFTQSQLSCPSTDPAVYSRSFSTVLAVNEALEISHVPFHILIKSLKLFGPADLPLRRLRQEPLGPNDVPDNRIDEDAISDRLKKMLGFFDVFATVPLQLHTLIVEINLYYGCMIQNLLLQLLQHGFIGPQQAIVWTRQPMITTSIGQDQIVAWSVALVPKDLDTGLRVNKIVLEAVAAGTVPLERRLCSAVHAPLLYHGCGPCQLTQHNFEWLLHASCRQVFGRDRNVAFAGPKYWTPQMDKAWKSPKRFNPISKE